MCRIQLLIPASASPWAPRVHSLRFWHQKRTHRAFTAAQAHASHTLETQRAQQCVETFEGSVRRRFGRWFRSESLRGIVEVPRGEALQTIFGWMDLIVVTLFFLDAANWRWSL